MCYTSDEGCWSTKEGELMEPSGGGEVKVLHQLGQSRKGKCVPFSFKRTLSSTNWSTARGEEPKKSCGIKSCQSKKWNCKPEKEVTWSGNDSGVQMWEVLSFRVNVVFRPRVQNLQIIRGSRFQVIWRNFVSVSLLKWNGCFRRWWVFCHWRDAGLVWTCLSRNVVKRTK